MTTTADAPASAAAPAPAPATAPAALTAGEEWRRVARYVLRAALRRARAIAAVFRPLAWIAIGLVVVLAVTGGVLGWWELTIAAVVLVTIVAVSAFFLIGRTDYDVILDLGRTRVVVGERAVGSLGLRNAGSRAILPSRVILPVGAGRGVFAVGRLAAGATAEELFAIPTQTRGVLPVGPVSVLRGDPLGLFERVHRRDEPVDLFVHPRTVHFSGQSLGFVRDLEGLPATDLSRDDVSFHALREYVPGDDLRHVHWKSTARTGITMVRQYEETRRSHFVIGLSRSASDYRSANEFELAISAAGSLGLRALRDSERVEVHVQGRTLPASTGKRFLDSLAALTWTRRRSRGVLDLAGTVAASAPQASVVVLVCGSAVDAATLRRACARLPIGARILALVAKDGVTRELRRIGEADVVTFGALDELPRALRKVFS